MVGWDIDGPLVITQNGEAKVVIQDIESYEQTQGTMALLKIPNSSPVKTVRNARITSSRRSETSS